MKTDIGKTYAVPPSPRKYDTVAILPQGNLQTAIPEIYGIAESLPKHCHRYANF
jgi:hypothetical protein